MDHWSDTNKWLIARYKFDVCVLFSRPYTKAQFSTRIAYTRNPDRPNGGPIRFLDHLEQQVYNTSLSRKDFIAPIFRWLLKCWDILNFCLSESNEMHPRRLSYRYLYPSYRLTFFWTCYSFKLTKQIQTNQQTKVQPPFTIDRNSAGKFLETPYTYNRITQRWNFAW